MRAREPIEQDVEQLLPGIEGEVFNESAQMLQEGASRGQSCTHRAVAFVEQIKDGMDQISEQDQACQHGAEVLLAVAVVVLEPVAFGFEDIVVFVLDFPTGAGPAATIATTFSAVMRCELAQALG